MGDNWESRVPTGAMTLHFVTSNTSLCGGQCVIRKQDLRCDRGFREVKLLHIRTVGFRGTDGNVKHWPLLWTKQQLEAKGNKKNQSSL